MRFPYETNGSVVGYKIIFCAGLSSSHIVPTSTVTFSIDVVIGVMLQNKYCSIFRGVLEGRILSFISK